MSPADESPPALRSPRSLSGRRRSPQLRRRIRRVYPSEHGSTQLLIRGFGPALARFGVTGALEDPVLSIYDRTGVLIATNDVWNSDPLLRASFLAANAFEPPTASKDAALLLRLQPGSYTAVLSRARGSGGDGLIEIYELP